MQVEIHQGELRASMRNDVWQEHFSVAHCLPASFLIAAPAQAFLSLQQHCALLIQILPSHARSKRGRCIHKILLSTIGVKCYRTSVFFCGVPVPFETETPLPTARLSFMPGITSRSFISYKSFPPSYSLILARSLRCFVSFFHLGQSSFDGCAQRTRGP